MQSSKQKRLQQPCIGSDQVIEVSFSRMSISQAAACSTARRCASFDLRNVALSSVNARL